ncbi:MAG: type II secretion system protein, partial [Anaerovoracaceae bacterium]
MKAKNNKKGFTLTELLVTVGIIIILTAVSMVAVVHYMNNLKVTEMDATAREVFVAAQNHMTAAKASGQWDSFIKENATNDNALGTLMSKAPADKPAELEWPVAGVNEKHSYRYIEYNPNKTDILDTSILQHMLPFGAIDEQVRNDSSYVIEYDAKTATVYSVFYTDNVKLCEKADVDTLDSTGGRADSETGRNTRRDYKKDGKRVVIGYYGGAMVKNLIAETLEKPELIIENGDQLLVKIIDKNYFKKASDVTTQLKTNVKVSITGEESKKTQEFMLELTDSGTKPEKKDEKIDPWWTVKKTGAGVMQALEYSLVLDDITSQKGHFANIFNKLIPGENFVIDVQIGSNNVLSQSVNIQGSSNSLFASNVADSNDSTGISSNVEVDCVRHLQNLSQSCSNLPITVQSTESGNTTKQRLVRNVKQTKDIDWDKSYFKDKSIVSYRGGNYGKDSFRGIKNSLLKSYNGQGKKISNFNINGSDAGLFQSVGAVNRKDIELKISNLLLVDFNVKGSGNVGTLVGTAYEGAKLTVDNVGAYISSEEKYKSGEYGVTGSSWEYSVGGLVGSVSENKRDDTELVISDSFASVPVKMANTTGKPNGGVGGIIGSIGLRKPVKITNTYSGGNTTDGKYDGKNYNIDGNKASAGGLIGKTWYKIIVDNCYSTCSVKGNNAGGFIGEDLSNTSTYNNCYATGLVSGTTAGAFSGSDLRGTANTCFYLKGINGKMTGGDKQIEGKSYADLSVKNTTENETHNYDTALKDKNFPFRTVNKNGTILTGNEIGQIAGVHYGDWPKLVAKIKDKSFAYKEVMTDGSVHWYVVGPQFDSMSKMSIVKSYDDLVTAKGKYVEKTSYGFLSSEKMQPGDFDKGNSTLKDYAEFPNGYEEVTIDGMPYYYYKIKDSKANADSDNAVDGVVVLPTCKIDKKNKVPYMYNPNFAAAMYSEADGTNYMPYQIRSDAQLRNINSRPIYYNLAYKQTCDINLVHGSSDPAPFDPIGG